MTITASKLPKGYPIDLVPRVTTLDNYWLQRQIHSLNSVCVVIGCGVRQTGKSTLAELLKTALSEAGFVNVLIAADQLYVPGPTINALKDVHIEVGVPHLSEHGAPQKVSKNTITIDVHSLNIGVTSAVVATLIVNLLTNIGFTHVTTYNLPQSKSYALFLPRILDNRTIAIFDVTPAETEDKDKPT